MAGEDLTPTPAGPGADSEKGKANEEAQDTDKAQEQQAQDKTMSSVTSGSPTGAVDGAIGMEDGVVDEGLDKSTEPLDDATGAADDAVDKTTGAVTGAADDATAISTDAVSTATDMDQMDSKDPMVQLAVQITKEVGELQNSVLETAEGFGTGMVKGLGTFAKKGIDAPDDDADFVKDEGKHGVSEGKKGADMLPGQNTTTSASPDVSDEDTASLSGANAKGKEKESAGAGLTNDEAPSIPGAPQ